MQVKVYALPDSVCRQCRFTKRELDRRGVEYEVVNLGHDSEEMTYIKSLGYSSAPVVEVDLGEGSSWHWSGFRPSQLEKLFNLL